MLTSDSCFLREADPNSRSVQALGSLLLSSARYQVDLDHGLIVACCRSPDVVWESNEGRDLRCSGNDIGSIHTVVGEADLILLTCMERGQNDSSGLVCRFDKCWIEMPECDSFPPATASYTMQLSSSNSSHLDICMSLRCVYRNDWS